MIKIAQISPLTESVPPPMYGGTERVVSYLTEELVELGHDVTLFASGDSKTKATLFPICQRSLRMDANSIDKLAAHILMIEKVLQNDGFDIIHSHIDYLPFPFLRRHYIPSVTTLHGRLDIKDIAPVFQEYNDIPLVSISNAQRFPLSTANWIGTVYHGLPETLYSFSECSDDYLVYIGRLCCEKRITDAIDIAIKSNRQLIIGGKIDQVDKDYFERQVKPLLDHPLVDYIGEINEDKKQEVISQAAAFLFPIDWPEPFGVVMIEAMACGTPVIARIRGSVPEVIEQGKNGFIFETKDEAVHAINRISSLDRSKCRETFEKRFTSKIMAQNYLSIYKQALSKPLRPFTWVN